MAYVSNTDPAIKRLQAQGVVAGGASAPSTPKKSTGTYVSDTDPAIKRLRGESVYTPSTDPLMDAASKPAVTTPAVTPQATPNLNINAFGANPNAHKQTGNMLSAAFTGMGANYAEAGAQASNAQLTIGEQARMAAEGKTTEAERQTAQKEKATASKEALLSKSDELAKKSAEQTALAKEGKGKAGQFMVDLGITGTQLLGDVALGAAVPGLGTLAMGTRAFGGAAKEARDAGATENQQQLYGLANMALSLGVEKLFQVGNVFKKAYGGGVADDVFEKLAGKLMKSPAGQNVLAGFFSEGSEEAIESMLSPLLKRIYDSNAIKQFDTKEAWAEYASDTLYNFLLGGALGAIGGAGNVNAPVETTTEAQNTTPNATAPRVEVEGDTDTPTAQNGTGGVVEANENGLISLTEREKTNLSSGVRNKVVTTFQDAVQFVRNALSNKDNTDRAYLGKVPDSTAQRVLQDTGVDVTGMGVMMNGINIRHIMKDHGDPMKEAARGQIPVTAEDIAKVPEIIASPDNVYLSDKTDGNGRKAIVFEKQFGDTYITIQGVSNGKKLLQTDTMYIKKGKPRKSQFPMTDAESTVPAINAQDALPQRLSINTTVAQPTDVVNSVGAAHPSQLPFSHAETLYGIIDGKANSVRPDDVPRSVDGKTRTSETVSTLKGADITSENFVEMLEDAVVDGKFARVPVKNTTLVDNVESRINNIGWDAAAAQWKLDARSGKVNNDMVTTGIVLYNNAVNSGHYQEALDIAFDLADIATASGRALQAFTMIRKMSPQGQLYGVQRSVANLQKELVEKYGDKAPNLVIDDALAQAVLDAKTQAERDAAMREIYKSIGKQMPSTFVDKFNAWRYLAMLGNVRTHVRNVVGNAAFAPAVLTKNAIASGIETAVERVSGKKIDRTKALVGVSAKDRGLLKAAYNYSAQMTEALQGKGKYSDLAQANKYIEEGRIIFKNKLLEKIRTGNAALLNAEDMLFSRPHFAYAMAQYCKANGITEADITNGSKAVDKAVQYAVSEALKATYRDTTALADILSRKLNETAKSDSKKDVAIARAAKVVNIAKSAVLPFTSTPANLLARGVEYGPVGVLKGIGQAVQAVTNGKSTPAEAVDTLASGLTGSGVLALGIYLATQGLVRGAGGGDDKQKDFDELQGHQPYSMELPNGKSVTLDWVAPMALPFFVGVNAVEAAREKTGDNDMSAILGAFAKIADPLLELSCLQSINSLIDSVGYSKDTGLMSIAADVALSLVMQMLPTVFGQLERITETERMTTYTDKNSWLTTDTQYALGKVTQRVPSIDYNQIPYIDAWGRTEDSGNLAQRIWDNALSPAYTSQIDTSDVERELQRLADATQGIEDLGTSLFPTRAGKEVGDKNLTAEEYTEYATTRGNEMYNLMESIVKNPKYKPLSDTQKAEILKSAKSYANAVGGKTVNPEFNGDSVAKAMVAAKKNGVSPEQYLLYSAYLDVVDKPSKNGNLGSYTNEEQREAAKRAGITGKGADYLINK